jgi:hypothetical protein
MEGKHAVANADAPDTPAKALNIPALTTLHIMPVK